MKMKLIGAKEMTIER